MRDKPSNKPIMPPARDFIVHERYRASNWGITLSAGDGLKVMHSAKYRLRDRPKSWFGGPWNHPEIYFDGEWMDVCRTDLYDDVATGLCKNKTLGEWIEHYTNKLRRADLGVRVRLHEDGRRSFAIIDAYTDG